MRRTDAGTMMIRTTPIPPAVHRRQLLCQAALAAVVGAFGLWAAPALAGWTSGGIGPGRSLAQSIPRGATPVAVSEGREVTVGWDQTQLSGGTPADGYVVRRYTDAGLAETVLDGCAGTIVSISCTESAVPTGIWRYTVEPVHAGWNGAESARSAAITVGTATLTFSSSTTIAAASLPATLNGTVSHFLADESVTFHLDGPTGPVLSGTPTLVDDTGSAAVTVVVPAGTDDAPHSVFAVGGEESVASATITIVDPPMLQTLEMFDDNSNGKIDRVVATFQEPLATYSAGIGPWTLAAAPSGANLSAVTVAGDAATLQLTEGGGPADTAVGAFTVALAENSSGIRDVNGQRGSFPATAPTDEAAPALTATPVMVDANLNGRVDQVTLTFSEPLASYTAGTTPWTLANVPSGGTLSAVNVPTSTTVTLVVTEGPGPTDTAVGAFRLGLAGDPTGIRDAAANSSSFTDVTPSDQAKPIRLTALAFDDNANGKFDHVAVTFSEPLASYGAGKTGWTFASAPTGSSLNGVTVSGPSADLVLNEGTTLSTAVGSWTVALSTNAAGIRDAAGNLASFTATALADRAAPRPTGPPQLFDAVSVNGRVDRVTIVMSETLAPYTAGVTPWTLSNTPSGGSLTSVATLTTTATLTLTEGAGAPDTAVGAMTVALAADPGGGIRDTAGNATALSPIAPLDKAKPFKTSQTIYDDNGNGKFDRVLTTFSEPLAPFTAPNTVWTFAGQPTGTTLNNVAVAGSTATLNLNEGSTVVTSVASTFKVGLAANAAGIRDAAANQASFTAVAPTDKAAPVVIGSPQLLDANLNGKVDKVTVTMSETLGTYTAGVTPWTVANVPSGGTVSSVTVATTIVTVNIAEGTGAADTTAGTMTVAMATNAAGVRDAGGNAAASFGPVAPIDKAAPARVSGSAFDDDGNGRFDRVAVLFSEPLAAYTAGTTPWTLTAPPAGTTLNTVTVSGSTATLALNEGSTQTTAIGSWTVALATNPAGIRDTADNRTTYAAAAPTDKAAPVPISLITRDTLLGDGIIDTVTVLMSEPLTTYTAGAAPWTLANVPSGRTLSSAAVSSSTVTLTLTGGTGIPDTTVGAFTIALAPSSTGVRDAVLNQSSFAGTAALDGAGPAPVAVTGTSGTTAGRIEPGDTFAVSLSEPLGPAVTLPTTTTVTMADPLGAGNDTLAITSILNGPRTSASDSYIGTDGASAAFASSFVLLSSDRRTITVTVGPTCAGTGCASITTAPTATAFSFLAGPGLLDAAANLPTTIAKTFTIRLF